MGKIFLGGGNDKDSYESQNLKNIINTCILINI